jgi:DNA (cytosine-5)-methyltransferase 1
MTQNEKLINMKHRFPYKWTLKDAKFTKDKGKVFSCFACGGGSTMGYKLAGFDVLGCNEIDPKMIEAYITNHIPKYAYLEPIQTFKTREDLPDELFNLDILDGSPPCSSFSMAGNREKDWGKEKKFREGQAEQVLDNLFFDFIDLAKKLQPKVVVAENVKGLLLGNAKEYVRRIYREFDLAGYYVQHWLLDASKMGVPQRRERVFFICLRKDLAEPFLCQQDMFTVNPKLELNFNEPEITFKDIFHDYTDRPLSEHYQKFWNIKEYGDIDFSVSSARMGKNPNAQFQYKYLYMDKVANTITAGEQCVLFDYPRYRNFDELCECGTYPKDYNFIKNKPEYLIGMSVPPVMTAQIATEIYTQWLSKIK